MPAVLLSRWGLEAVVVADDQKPPSPASAAEGEEDPDEEVTGRALWDCTQVLWDLVADPNPQNVFTVRGKVGVQTRLHTWMRRRSMICGGGETLA